MTETVTATAAAIIFDLDGTLVDLPVDIAAVRREVAAYFESRGHRGTFSPILAGIEAAAARVASDPHDSIEVARGARAIIDRAELVAASSLTPDPAIVAVVSHLAQRGWALGIVTNNSRACLRPALRSSGLRGVPWVEEALISRDDVATPKPSPEGVERACRVLGGIGGVVVGDGLSDMMAAVTARPRLRAIGLRGRHSPAELRAAGADEVIDDLGGLLSVL